MAKHLILHIGLHKTASTYVQRTLAASRAQLREHGIDYPPGGRRIPGHSRFRELCESPGTDTQARTLSHYVRLIEESPEDCVILSSEWLSMAGSSALAALADSFRDFNLGIVCFFRNQVERLQSFYSEDAKKFLTIGFEEWLTHHIDDHHYRYDEMLVSWREIFGSDSVNALIYEEIGNPALAVLEIAGFDPTTTTSLSFPTFRANRSKGLRTLALNRLLCRMAEPWLGPENYRSTIGKAVRAYGERQQWNEEPLDIFTDRLLEATAERFLVGNRRLEKMLDRTLPPEYFGSFENPPTGNSENPDQTRKDLVAFIADLADNRQP